MRKQEEIQGEAVMKVFNACPEVNDFEMIKSELMVANWNADTVISKFQQGNKIQFCMINCANPAEQITSLSLSKADPSITGMSIIEFMVKTKPLSGNTAYNIYKDQQKH